MVDYRKRFVEVSEILEHLSKEDYKKIPKDIINIINTEKDKNYVWKYNNLKRLKDQEIHSDTIAILAYINLNYLLNSKQKEFINQLYCFYNKKKV